MIGKTVTISRETEKQLIIQQLNILGIFENMKSEPLDKLSYHALVHLLATEQAVRT